LSPQVWIDSFGEEKPLVARFLAVFPFCQSVHPGCAEYFRKEEDAMAEGTVKWFSEKKGYGFIEQDDGEDIFVHHTGINGAGFKTLDEGQRVRFEIETSPRGPKAINVESL
jgi:CspA family cold shock protein